MDCKVEPDAPTPESSEDQPTVSNLHNMEMVHCSNSCPNTTAIADSTAAAHTMIAMSHEEPQETGESLHEQPAIKAGAMCPTPTSAMKKAGKSRGHRNGRRGIAKSQLTCKVDGCNAVLSASKAYYQRHRVCATHLAAMSAAVDGVACRFCQQCGKFQPTEEFDSDKRSCRARLKRHNNRRREQRHSKSSQQLCPAVEDRLNCIVLAGLACSDPGNLDTPAGKVLQSTADTGSNTTEGSPNPSGDNSCSATVRVSTSPGTPAGQHPAATIAAAAAAAACVVGVADKSMGRATMRRNSANKALAAFKSMTAASHSAASEFEGDDMEEDHQHSPMVAAAAAPTAFKPRRRLNMAAATAASFAAAEGQQAARHSSSQLPGSAKQQGVGFSSLRNSEIAAAIEAAAAGGSHNKCAMSVAGSTASCELGFSSSRPQLGLSRFALQSSAVMAAAESGPCSQQQFQQMQQQQQQQWGSAGSSAFQLQNNSSSSSRDFIAADSSQYPHGSTCHGLGANYEVRHRNYGGLLPGQVPRWLSGSLAQQHSAPPLLHAEGLEAAYAGPDAAIRAAAAASRFSDAGQLLASAAGHAGQHQQPALLQQQSLPSTRTAEDPFTARSTADDVSHHQYSNFNAATATDSESSSRHYSAMSGQQQGQHPWPQHVAQASVTKPLSLQVLMQLRSQGLLVTSGQPRQQHPHAHHQLPSSIGQHPTAEPAGAVVSNVRTSDSGLMALPVHASTLQQQQQSLLGRPYASYSGADGVGALLQSPSGSLTAPLRGDLAGISLERTGSVTGWQGPVQQQHSSWPGNQLVQPEQQLAALEQQPQGLQQMFVRQGSLQYQQLQSGFAAHETSHKVAVAASAEGIERWKQGFPIMNGQTAPMHQQQPAQQVQPQQLTKLEPDALASMQPHQQVKGDTILQHASLDAGPGPLVTACNHCETDQELSVKQPASTQHRQYGPPLSPEHYLPTDDAYTELQHPCPENHDDVPYACTDEEAAIAAAAAAEYQGSPFDEDFGDLLDILLEGEAAGQ